VKRLLLLSYYYPPDLCAGSFRSEALVRSLLADNPELSIHVIASEPARYSNYQAKPFSGVTEEGRLLVSRIPILKHGNGFLPQSINFAAFAWRALRLGGKIRYDVIFATTSRLMTGVLGAFLASRHGAKLYLDIRDIFVETLQGLYPRKIFRPMIGFFSLIERFTLSRAEKINLVSAGFLPYFQLHYPNRKFSLFTNGVDNDFLPKCLDERNKSERKKIQILYAGNIGDGQGLDLILPELAIKLGSAYEIIVVGAGARTELLEKAIAAAKAGNIKVLAPVSRDELPRFYNEADALFLHLNDIRAFERVLPSKIFEYAATGKPILAGVSGYASEFIKKEVSNAVVFPPCEAGAAVEALSILNFTVSPRVEFVDKYARTTVMKEMSKDLMSLF